MNQPLVYAHVDDTTFKRNMETYINNTSKTVEEAINFKLYDATREAVKDTPKADKNTIKEKLNYLSTRYHGRTVAEMMVIKQKQESGENVYDLQDEVKALIDRRTAHIAFVKGGWLPGIKKLLAKIGKSFVNINGVQRSSFGGAEPAKLTGGTLKAFSFNDVEGFGNKDFVETIKEHGAQQGVDKVNSDIATYLSKKLDRPIESFNNA